MFELERRMSFTAVVFPGSAPASGLQEAVSTNSRDGVVRVLVGALGDPSTQVREAAVAALQDLSNARENAELVLETCSASLRSSKRHGAPPGSHHAAVLRVVAATVQQMEERQLNDVLLHRLAKLAVLEMVNTKDLDSEWQLAASGLLVAIGLRRPDVMIAEAFVPPPGHAVPIPAVVRALAEFAEKDAVQMVPRLRRVLSRVLPVLGGVYDGQRSIFAKAMSSWCEAAVQYQANVANAGALLDGDMQAGIRSAFELFSGRWLNTRDPKVPIAVVEAIGRMAGLIGRAQLKASLPKLLPAVLGLYRRKLEEPQVITRSLRAILQACLGKDKGAPLVDFQGLVTVLTTLLPKASYFPGKESPVNAMVVLKNCNEVLGCFGVVGSACPDDMCAFLIHRIGNRDEPVRMGTFAVLRYLIFWLRDQWEGRRAMVVDAMRGALQEEELNLRKGVAQVIVAMAANGYLGEETAEPFIKFLVWQCRNPGVDKDSPSRQLASQAKDASKLVYLSEKDELKLGVTTSAELFAICDKSLLLLSATLLDLERPLWLLFLKVLVPLRYTGAVATVCKCIIALSRHRTGRQQPPFLHVASGVEENQLPQPNVLLARLLVLLENVHAPEDRARHILKVLGLLAPFFHQHEVPAWSDQISKMETFLSEAQPEIVPDDTGQRGAWEKLIVELLSISLDAVPTQEWAVALANAFSAQYDLYMGDHDHAALLHRCLGLAVQRVENRNFVREKINLMYKRADIANESNREGLAMGMGLVAANHVDTVLDKLRRVLETEGRSWIRWILSFFWQTKQPNADDVCAALALMYGYVASYAPSSALQVRIEGLVGTNVLTHLIDVYTPAAKQAVITAIDLLARAVRRAADNNLAFPLKKRDDMIGYMMTYMAGAGYSLVPPDPELLKVQATALNAITHLVCVEPKLGVIVRDRILQATVPYLALPAEPSYLVKPVVENLKSLLCAILLTSGEDARSNVELLLLLLRHVEPYATSSAETRRCRACTSAFALLCQFRLICTGGRSKHIFEKSSHLPLMTGVVASRSEEVDCRPAVAALPLLPPRTVLRLGDHIVAFLPRCTDTVPLVRVTAVRVLHLFFSIALLFPQPLGLEVGDDKDAGVAALSALENLIRPCSEAESTEEQVDTFRKVVSAVGVLLTQDELIDFFQNASVAIGDKTLSAARGAVMGATQLILLRGHELIGPSLPRITDGLLTAASATYNDTLRQDVLAAVCALAEHAQAGVVFNELLAALERDPHMSARTLGPRRREPWPLQEALEMVASSPVLGRPLLDHLVDVLEKAPLYNEDSYEGSERSWTASATPALNLLPQATTLALGIAFRTGGDVVQSDVEARYASLMSSLLLRMGAVHSSADSDSQPVKDLVSVFQAFCDCTSHTSMKEVLAQDGEMKLIGEDWIDVVANIAAFQVQSRPSQVEAVCERLQPALKEAQEGERTAATAALSEYVQHCDGEQLQDKLVEALIFLTADTCPVIRRLAVSGLVRMRQEPLGQHAPQVLAVAVARAEDADEGVALTAMEGLPKVLELSPQENVAPLLLSLCLRLRALQSSLRDEMRAAAFTVLGSLTRLASEDLREVFLEQMYIGLPRLLLHVNDDSPAVRAACKGALQQVGPLLGSEELAGMLQHKAFRSDRRLKYAEFLRDFVRHLAAQGGDRAAVYMTAALQGLESPWPAIQANAALFAGFFLAQLEDARLAEEYILEVTPVLTRMATSAANATVRAKSTSALSMLLSHIKLQEAPS